MYMLLTEKMKEDLFSPSEQTIIDYMFEERETIGDKTTKQIADETYTHPSSLVRVAKKLGFAGWLEFKEKFIEEIDYLKRHLKDIDSNFKFNEDNNVTLIASKMALLNQKTVEDPLSLLQHEELQKAAEYL